MRMKLWAGRNPNIGTEVIFNIFDLLPEDYAEKSGGSITVSQYDITIPGDNPRNFKTLYFDKTDSTFLHFLFPENIPKQCTDDGNIIMVSGGMVYDDSLSAYTIADVDFETIQGGSEPDDWKTARFEYYYRFNGNSAYSGYPFKRFSNCRTNENTQASYSDVYGFNVLTGTPYDTSATYYHNNNVDPRKHLCQLYTADTGSSFGIWRNFDLYGRAGCGIGSIWTEAGDSASNNYGTHTPFFYAPFGVDPHSYYYGKNIKNLYLIENPIHAGGAYTPIEQSASITIFISYVYDDVQYYGVALVTMSGVSADAYPVRIQAQLFSASFWGDSIISGGSSGGNWGADTVIDGGNGTFSAVSDPHGDGTGTDIALTVTALNTASGYFAAQGGINVYRLDGTAGNISGLTGILQILFSSDYFTKFLTSMYNPLSAVLSAHLLPQALTTASGSARHVTAGGFDVSNYMSGTPSAAVASQFTHLHFAPIDIPHFSDSFADFAPYTSAKLHLPYCGVIDIDINKCMGGKLGVDYVCDAISGNVAAWVWVSDPKDANCKQYAYIATGNAAYSFPMFAETQSGAAVGKLIGAAGSAAVGALTGNPFAAAGALSAGIDAVLTGHNTQISGTFSGNVGILTDPLCWLEITRPLWVQPSAFQQLHGITSHLSGTLADSGGETHTPYSGFVVVSEIDLVTVNATDAELQEIERLLKSGVFIRTE